MKTDVPDPEAIRAALQRVTSSRTLDRSTSLANLLRYIVEKAISGESDQIKEYTIAVEVFGRPAYDPKVDSLVRVEAAKLRTRLESYYASEGSRDPVRIEIPKGAYVASFRYPPALRLHRILRLALGVAVAILLVWGGYRIAFTRRPAPPGGTLSIAVIPFSDVSPSKDVQHLCDGLTQELTAMLARLEDVRVSQPGSRLVEEVRRMEDVQTILEGTVRVEGGRARVITHFLDSRGGYQLWSHTFDREIAGTADLPREIARDIFRGFEDLRLLRRALVRPQSRNAQARHYYLRAVQAGLSEPSKAIELYQAAVAADPNYALAWAGLAGSWLTAFDWGEISWTTAIAKAVEAADRAMAIDPDISEAHQSLAKLKVYEKQDWAGAEREFRRAIELDPTHVEARHDYAMLVLIPRGRFAEAVEELERAIALDSGKNLFHLRLASVYIKARQYDKAVQPLAAARKISQTSPALSVFEGIVAAGTGKYEQALPLFEKSVSRRVSAWAISYAGHTYAKLGREREARQIIARLEQLFPGKVSFHYEIAAVHAGLGNTDSAFAALDRALANHEQALIWANVDYRMDDLRGDARFGRLLKAMKLE